MRFRTVLFDRAVVVSTWRHPLPVLAALVVAAALVAFEAHRLRGLPSAPSGERTVHPLSPSEAARAIRRICPPEWWGSASDLVAYRVVWFWESETVCRSRDIDGRTVWTAEPYSMVSETRRGWPFALISRRISFGANAGGMSATRWSMRIPGAAGVLLTAFTLLLPIAGMPRWLLRVRRARRGRCPICAFDLRATVGPGCTECGWRRGGSVR